MFNYSVKIKEIPNPKGKIVAFASLVIEDVFEVDGFKIINGAKGYFVSHPQHKGKDKDGNDTYFDDVRFSGDTADAIKEEIHRAIIQQYNRSGGNQMQSRAQTAQSANKAIQPTQNSRQQPTQAPSPQQGRQPLW